MKGDKLGRQAGSGNQERNHEGRQASQTRRQRQPRQAWETRRQRQPRAKSRREASLGNNAAAAAKSEIMKGDKLHKQGGSGSRDKLGRQGGSGSQERNHEGRQAWETMQQQQPKAKS